jgi:hypothetical protein
LRGWLSEKTLMVRLGKDFLLDIPFHRTNLIKRAPRTASTNRKQYKFRTKHRSHLPNLIFEGEVEMNDGKGAVKPGLAHKWPVGISEDAKLSL